MIGDTIADSIASRGFFSSLTRISQIEATDRTPHSALLIGEIVREVWNCSMRLRRKKGGQLNTLGISACWSRR